MRLFFGLDLAAPDKLAIETWRQQALPAMPAAIPAANFHITLAFLGQAAAAQVAPLCQAAERIQAAPFALQVDQLGYWPKPKVLWIGPSEVPPALHSLAEGLANVGARLGFRKESRPYMPHISLVRKVAFNPPCALLAPAFHLTFTRFCLFESISTARGVLYRPLASWPLAAETSTRERLRRGYVE